MTFSAPCLVYNVAVTKKHAEAAYIKDKTGLKALCERLRDHERLAVDTEFIGEDSFHPRLEIIQVVAGDVAAIIDHQAVTELDHFFDLLGNARIHKIMHAGRQDLEIFSVLSGSVPAPIFDTQVAAAMVGYGPQVGYAPLVQQVVGIALDKSETFTNWAQRPLTPQQVALARVTASAKELIVVPYRLAEQGEGPGVIALEKFESFEVERAIAPRAPVHRERVLWFLPRKLAKPGRPPVRREEPGEPIGGRRGIDHKAAIAVQILKVVSICAS